MFNRFIWSVLTYKIGRRGVLLCTTVVCCTAFTLVYLAFPSDAATTQVCVMYIVVYIVQCVVYYNVYTLFSVLQRFSTVHFIHFRNAEF